MDGVLMEKEEEYVLVELIVHLIQIINVVLKKVKQNGVIQWVIQ